MKLARIVSHLIVLSALVYSSCISNSSTPALEDRLVSEKRLNVMEENQIKKDNYHASSFSI
jgi:hypothetical protein